MLTLINELLDVASLDAGRLELQLAPFRPGEVVEDALEAQAARARQKGLELASHMDERVPEWVEGDAGRFRQIVINLVGNAVKFTDAGSVRVTLAAEPPVGQQVMLRLSVSDTGIGIPAAKYREIFEAFTQVDASNTRRHGGAGLGLAITAKLTGLMGGEVAVVSEVGRGSTFTVTLPVKAVTGAPSD